MAAPPALAPEEHPEQKTGIAWALYMRIALYLFLGITILGFTGKMFWWADFFAQPRIHIAALTGLLGILFLLMLDWVRVVFALAAVGLNILAMTSAVSGVNNIQNALDMPPGKLRVVTLNVGDISPNSRAIAPWLASVHPDVVVLIEANRKWLPQLDQLVSTLPYQKMVDHTTEFGIAILSRFPMSKTENSVAGPNSLPTLTAEMETPLGRIAIMAVHPNAPYGSAESRARDLYLAQIAAIAQTTSMPTLMVGDFNAAPWSSGYETIRMLPNLQPSSLDVPPTWPAILGPAGLPTQNILLSIPYSMPRDLRFTSIKAGAPVAGASHLPLIADIAVKTR